MPRAISNAPSATSTSPSIIAATTTLRIVGVVRPGGAIATLKGANAAGEAAARDKGVRVERVFVQPNGEVLERIAERLATGKLQIAVDRTVPLAEASTAHTLVDKARGRGRIVLDVTG